MQVPPSPRVPTSRVPVRGGVAPPRRWTFSFRFWRQIQYFGLDKLNEISDSWFVSLLERLHELSTQSVDEVRDSMGVGGGTADALRFHKIDHDHEHVTMLRAQFDWVDRAYLEAEVSYPFCQVHISKSLGRIVGFFDENHTFNVLLLDPRHNLWLSNYNGYRKRDCDPLDSHYATLKYQIDKAIGYLDGGPEQSERARTLLLSALADRTAPAGVTRFVVGIDAGYELEMLKVLTIHRGKTLRLLIEAGLVVLADETTPDPR